MNQKEAENKGIDISTLPQTKIDVTGATEGKITNWKKMSIHIRSNETGIQHREDIYISPEAKNNIISYATLKRLGYIRALK